MLEINKIYQIDCLNGFKQIEDESVDIIVTSPPYKEKDGWSLYLMSNFLEQSHRVLKNGSLFFLNFGHLSEDKWRPFGTLQMALNYRFKLNETIVWEKNHFTPLIGNKHLNNLTEFIFVLYKGDMPDLNRLSIGVPYKDKSNAKRYNNGLDLRCAGNIWKINIPTITNKKQRLHKDEFPIELPLKCLKLSGLKNGLVLDPFSGSGTSALAAKELGLNYIGFEKNENYFEISKKRLSFQ